jgi:hypothetical protein
MGAIFAEGGGPDKRQGCKKPSENRTIALPRPASGRRNPVDTATFPWRYDRQDQTEHLLREWPMTLLR